MKKLIRLGESRTVGRARLGVAALAVAAGVVGTAGIAAGQGDAAPTRPTDKASHLRRTGDFKRPKLRHGVLSVAGTEASDAIALRLRAGDPGTLEVDVGSDGSADFSFDRARVTSIAVDARAGDDLVRIDDGNGAFTDSIATTIDGGAGNDRIAGGKGAETLLGGDGNDSIDGNGGNDRAFMGSGDDTFVWDPGDGSDTVEGEDGSDTMLFNGAAAAEQVDLSANGNRLKFFRNPGAVTMDTAGVERVDFIALGGADLVTVDDLSGTDVRSLNLDLGVGGAGDGQSDRIVVNGTNDDDTINVSGDAGGVNVKGLAPTIGILHAEAANDRLEINTLGGRDTVDPRGLAVGAIQLFVDGALVP
jgi:Ca2+-binding RTX toxin-like protein